MHIDAAVHAVHQTLHDGEAETRAAIAPRNASVGLGKRLEQPRQHVGCDADTGIPHPQLNVHTAHCMFTKNASTQGDRAGVGELHRVA